MFHDSLQKLNCLKAFKNKFPFASFGKLCRREFSKSLYIKSRNTMAASETVDHEMEEKTKPNLAQTTLVLDKEEVTIEDVVNKSQDKKKLNDKTEDIPTNPMLAGLSKRAQKRMLKHEINKARRKATQKKSLTKNLTPGFSTDYFGLTEYYYENGLRKVYPYYFKFESYVKERWFGKTITQVLKEFQVDPEERIKSMEDILKDGDVTLNGEAITTDRKLKSNDYIAHRIHRHENPVIGSPLDVLVDDEDVIVINKPSSIPVHPCGRYRFNSIPFIIGKDLGYTNLRTIYRLDRLTSGLLILAKSAAKTREMEDDILQRRVRKEYLARVYGKFPEHVVECDQSLGVLSSKDSLYGVVPGGKTSKTVFEYISYNGTSSLIRCLPETGRTHQIRLHLQYLGFPIKNDPLYNQRCFGPNNAKGGVLDQTLTEIVKSYRENHNTGLWVKGENPMFQERLEEIKVQADQTNHIDIKQQGEADSSHSHKETCESKPQEEACKASSSSQSEGSVSDSNLCEKEASALSVDHRTCLSEDEPKAKRCRLVDSNSGGDTVSGTADQCGQSTVSVTTDQCGKSAVSVTADQCGQPTPVRTAKRPEFDSQKWIPDAQCFYCKKSFKDPAPSDMIMYLHALKYKGPKWEYETPLPDWAGDDWIEPV